jgi:hypothetical protein
MSYKEIESKKDKTWKRDMKESMDWKVWIDSKF